MSQVAGRTSCQARHPTGLLMGDTLLEGGVVDRRSEEQGDEAGSSATQLAVRQSVVPRGQRCYSTVRTFRL
jgi:hypothetical protein